MIEVIFLFALAFIWVAFAAISDIKTTEIYDWLSSSLVIFALGFRFFYSLFSAGNLAFFYQGLIGFGIFFVLGILLYYSRIFAGGDAKLMMALGAILPFSTDFYLNVKIFITFILIFLVVEFVYGMLASFYIAAKNFRMFRKEFKTQNTRLLKFTIPSCILGVAAIVLGILYNIFLAYLGVMILVLPWIYVFSKSVDESCMVKKVSTKKLVEGDWLYKDVKVGKRTIKANWDGLTNEDIKTLGNKFGEVTVRRGIAFAPGFFISLIVLVYVYFVNIGLFYALWNSFW